MRRWLSTLSSAFLALVLAVWVWVAAVQEQNPRDWYPQMVPLNRTGLAQNVAVFGEVVGQVRLQIRAPRDRWQQLQPQDFTAWIDLTGLTQGSYDVPVHVTPPDPQVQVLEVDPPVVHIALQPREAKRVPVHVNVLDSPALGYDSQSAVITPTMVVVSGAASFVNQVAEASADMYLRDARANVTRSALAVSARDVSGQAVSFVDVQPQNVDVTVPIKQLPGYREVAVLVETTGVPASGYSVGGVTSDPKLATLFGDPSAVAHVSAYITVPVDITGATQDVQEQVPLRLPENVSTIDTQSVDVQISIVPIPGSQTVRSRPIIQGLGPGLTYTLSMNEVSLFLLGPVPKLRSLKSDAAPIILDLTGLGAGTHVIEPKVLAPDGITVQSMSPQSIEISIDAIPTPVPTATRLTKESPIATRLVTATLTVTATLDVGDGSGSAAAPSTASVTETPAVTPGPTQDDSGLSTESPNVPATTLP